jgi:hypothetical protein
VTGRLAAAVAIVSAALATAPPVARAAADELADALGARGFENVAVRTAGRAVTVWYENRILRYELTAMGTAAAIAAARVDADAILELVPQNRGVPLLSVSAAARDWSAFLDRRASSRWFRGRVVVTAADGAPRIARPAGLRRAHRSTWRTDLRVRPLVDFDLGVVDDPFRSSLRVAPEAVTSPFRGALLTAQLDVAIDEGLYGLAAPVAPGRNTLSWGGWLPRGWLVAASGGIFAGDRWGVAGEIGRLSRGGAFEIRAGGDWSGLLEFTKDVTLYTGLDAWSAFVAVTHRTEGLDLETTVTAARFLEGDPGLRVDVDRRWGEVEVGFFVVGTHVDEILGVNLRLPLPTRAWSRPARLRVTTVPAFPFRYRDSLNEVGQQVSLFDDLDRLRKRLYPTFVRNNLDDLLPRGVRRPE